MGPAGRELRLIAGRFVLAAVGAWAVGAWLVSASFLWTPRGTVGVTANYDARVNGVAAGSPAAIAGIVAGDRIDLASTPFASRSKLVGVPSAYPAGTRVQMRLEHAGIKRDLTLVAVSLQQSPADRLSLLSELVSSAIFIVVGAILILFRPSPVTWGFGLYCLLSDPVVPALSRFPSANAHLAYVAVYDVLQNVGVVGLILFALRFPHTLERPWRRTVERVLPLAFLVLAAWTLWIDLAVCIFARPAHVANQWLQVAFGIADLVAIAAITETYVYGPVEDRPRLRWVLVGFYVGLVCNYVGNSLLYTANVVLPSWLEGMLIALVVTLPLAVGYAVVRHRVIEIDFFVSRAIVYALFTSALVLLFAFIDWLFNRLLADFRLSLLFEAIASIGAAFAFDAVHKRVERAVDELLFRSRRLARERLERLARAFRHVRSMPAIDAGLVEDPMEALALASIALFRLDGDSYHRVASGGWPDGMRESLGKDDRLVLEHRASMGCVRLAELAWHPSGLPAGLARPALSIPLLSRHEVVGVLLCGSTVHGEQLDPEELLWLEQLVGAASTTYDELEAERLRRTTARLRREVAILGARLEEARGQTARG